MLLPFCGVDVPVLVVVRPSAVKLASACVVVKTGSRISSTRRMAFNDVIVFGVFPYGVERVVWPGGHHLGGTTRPVLDTAFVFFSCVAGASGSCLMSPVVTVTRMVATTRCSSLFSPQPVLVLNVTHWTSMIAN